MGHHLLQRGRDALMIDVRGGEDIDLVAVVEVQLVGLDGADAQEVEVVAVPHMGQLGGPPLGGAVGQNVPVHLVAEIEVGVDVDNTEVLLHRPVDAPVDGDRHRVVAADHGEELAGLHGPEGQLLRLGEHLVPVLPHAVPQILHLQGGDVPEILGGGGDGVGDLPQLLGRLAGAGAEADAPVIGDAEYRDVHILQGELRVVQARPDGGILCNRIMQQHV